MNNPFDYTPDGECEEAFRKLIAKLETLKGSDDPKDVNFLRELDAGKMLGVLIATDSCGLRHTLYAFSGQLGDGGLYHPGFVGPVFDYLQPGGYFKTKEMEISRQNIDISLFEEGQFSKIRSEYERAKGKFEAEVSEYKERCRLSKIARNAKRESGITDKDEIAAMIRQSQFEKAELHRLKKRAAERLEPLLAAMNEAQSHIDTLKERRHMDSEALQQWLFSNFTLLNARGESRTLSEIFSETPLKIPPSGAGECCAPKLLQAAYLRGWKPIAIAEYWYGHAKSGEIRIDGAYYPACRGKCLPVLGWMLQGLDVYPPLESGCGQPVVQNPEIIYENRWFCVVDKPSGMLSVPGKGNAVSVQQWLEEKYGSGRSVRMAHRLDQDTSGLLIATFGNDTLKVMQSLFATRKVKKTYVAELVGDYRSLGISRCGHIELPLSPDWLDRPRQRVDLECGKEAVTYYEFTGAEGGRSRVEFRPVTGRTHQLRIHAASEMGLGMPIAGDRLYGRNIGNGQRRLHLHAEKLEFTFPTDGNHYCFESPAPF
ncbi:RluA family pseudouridine synthase [Muribaculaceae bacterium Isolate-001 (NCI)]|nr:RluA family pseudouridine synthase [Muribaculaceae bacterium Isolate-001 (NCI)]